MKFTSLILPLIVALLTGCVSTHSGTNFDGAKVSNIQKGKTTKNELISMFGKPDESGSSTVQGDSLTWSYSDGQAGFGGATSSNRTLRVWLDQSGVVTNFDYSTGHFDSNSK